MEGRSSVRRREEKKPTAAERSAEDGGWKRPRGSEKEDGWEREQWPETEMESAGGGTGRWDARPKRRPSQSPVAAEQRWRRAARAAPEMERLGQQGVGEVAAVAIARG
ncbi:unnamed protein product [Urochloa humidicola]